MVQRSHHSPLKSLFAGLGTIPSKESVKLADEADALMAQHGEEAVDLVRGQIVSADRKARRALYRLHDELVRRRREHGDSDAIMV